MEYHMFKNSNMDTIILLTWSLVLTTHNGLVVIAVAAPAPEAASIFAPKGSSLLLSTAHAQIDKQNQV